MSSPRLVLAAAAALTVGLCLRPAPARAYPTDFVDELVAEIPGAPVVFVCTNDGRFFVGDIFGSIYDVSTNGTVEPQPMITLDVENYEEQGLLGLALDPGFPTAPYLYVLYTPSGGSEAHLFHRISRFWVVANRLQPNTERILHATLPTGYGYHVGGDLEFGPDGKLYASVGENGYNGEELYPQELGRLEGKLIRINRDGTIPADNPFYATPGAKKEIFQRGFRNPFRFTFQPATGLLWVNDVGPDFTDAYDEIDVGGAGANFGFPMYQGVVANPPAGISNPLHAIRRVNGACITGGAFYTGGPFPAGYDGNYFWLDHVRGQINRMTLGANNTVQAVTMPWGQTASGGWFNGAVDLKMGPDGALYYCTYDPGQLRRIRFLAPVSAPPGADRQTALEPPAPNPSAGAVQIRFALETSGHAKLGVFDLAGRRVAALEDGTVEAGEHAATWSGRDLEGKPAAPGIYFVRLETRGREFTRRVARVR